MEIKFYINKFETHFDHRTFYKASIKGKYIPAEVNRKSPIEKEAFYNIVPVGIQIPNEEGFFHVFCDEAWIDEREGFKHKCILRVKGNLVMGKVEKEALTESK